MLDFRYQTFIELCKIKNYTKTAEYLHITQPAVTQHIKYLEDIYGGKLFNYKGKVLSLTQRGKLLYDFTSTMITDSLQIRDIVSSANDESIVLSFGATRTIGEYVMPKILQGLMEKMPNLHFAMPVENTQILLQMMRDGEISFAFLEGFFDKFHYDSLLFSTDDFIAICSS